MKPKGKITGAAYAKTAFTIIELLTIMSIIVILIGLLLPSMNMIRKYAKVVVQKNVFRNIDSGMQAFEIDFKEYPPSDATDTNGEQYCGAMKLAEAMAGQDGLGFNPASKFTANDGSGNTELYPRPAQLTLGWYTENLKSRKEYLEPKDVQICSLLDLYGSSGAASSFNSSPGHVALLCDVFMSTTNRNTNKRMGMPILYYKADSTKLTNDANTPGNPDNIYNYKDNHDFLGLGLPWATGTMPPLYQTTGAPPKNSQGWLFYQTIQDNSALPIKRPHNKDGYILISAGWDGIYGTKDDVYNFAD